MQMKTLRYHYKPASLGKERKRGGESVNAWVLGRFRNGFSVSETQKRSVYNELKSC